MKKTDLSGALIVKREEKKAAAVRTIEVGAPNYALEALGKPNDGEYPQIDKSWIDSAVNRKLQENKYSPYDGINAPAALWSAACYGDDAIIAVSSNGKFIRSINGGWTWEEGETINGLTCITYGNGKFITLSSEGKGALSIDQGKTFGPLALPVYSYSGIAYAGGAFVAASSDGHVIRSDNGGETWTEIEPPERAQFTAIISNGAQSFFILASSGSERSLFSSDTGNTWASYPMPENNQWVGGAYGEGIYVAVSTDGDNRFAIWDGETGAWEAVKAPEQNSWRAAAYGDGIFTAISSDGVNRAASSYDGRRWIPIKTPAGTWSTVTRSSYFFIAFSSESVTDGINAMRSSDGGLTTTLFATTQEAIAGKEPNLAISPKTLKETIDSNLPWDVEKGGTGAADPAGARFNLGLGNVDNTSDIDKPVSTAQREAIDGAIQECATYTDEEIIKNGAGRKPIASGTDLNAVIEPGEYVLGSGCLNMPEGLGGMDSGGLWLAVYDNGGNVAQELSGGVTSLYSRVRVGDVFEAWILSNPQLIIQQSVTEMGNSVLSASKTYANTVGRITLPAGTDLDTVIEPGAYYLGTSYINGPEGISAIKPEFNVKSSAPQTFLQEIVETNAIGWQRVVTGGTPGDWIKVSWPEKLGQPNGIATLNNNGKLAQTDGIATLDENGKVVQTAKLASRIRNLQDTSTWVFETGDDRTLNYFLGGKDAQLPDGTYVLKSYNLPLQIDKGGTGGSNVAEARRNLGIPDSWNNSGLVGADVARRVDVTFNGAFVAPSDGYVCGFITMTVPREMTFVSVNGTQVFKALANDTHSSQQNWFFPVRYGDVVDTRNSFGRVNNNDTDVNRFYPSGR